MLNLFIKYLKTKLTDSKGQGMVEYGLIIAVIAIVVLVALTPLGSTLANVFTNIVNSIRGVTPGGGS